MTTLAGLSAMVVSLPASAATQLTGPALTDLQSYGIIALGSGKTLAINSGPISALNASTNNGNVLVGNGVTVALSGGNNGGIPDGALYTDGTASISGSLQNPITTFTTTTGVTNTVLNEANTLSDAYDALTPTATYGNITSATNFTGNGGLNVIAATSIHNASLTFTGGANDFFVVNIGTYMTNIPMTLSGVSAKQIVFNFTATSGNCFQTSGGDQPLYGTFLSTDGCDFQFSQLGLTGALINTAGGIQFVSGSTLVSNPIPVPPAAWLFGSALGLLGLAKRKLQIA